VVHSRAEEGYGGKPQNKFLDDNGAVLVRPSKLLRMN